MSDNHGNTPAAWTAVSVAMLGFVVGAVGLMLPTINWVVLWIGVGIAIGAFVLFLVMAKLGYHESHH